MQKEITIQDIDHLLHVIGDSIRWASEHEERAFPLSAFREYRRNLKKIRFALEENCSAAAYGESQNGKSYLISSLLSDQGEELAIKGGRNGKIYSFIDDINPSGGNTSKKESTGIITRFTICPDMAPAAEDKVKVRLLSIADIVKLLADTYYKDVKINADTLLLADDINCKLETFLPQIIDKNVQQSYIDEDDIFTIQQYLNASLGGSASHVYSSKFCVLVSQKIQHIAPEQWGKVFCLLWNENDYITSLFERLVAEYRKLHFNSVVYVPFDAILRQKGTILDISWLDNLFNDNAADNNPNYELLCDIYDSQNNLLVHGFPKTSFTALISELTLVLPPSAADKRAFLRDFDLLDFPGARHRMKLPENSIQTELPMMLRRGKVSYLFDKYSDSWRINAILFCKNMDKPESELGEVLNSWINNNIGATPEQRAKYISSTNFTSPFFIISTFFNCDLQRTKETPLFIQTVPLEERWKTRFENHLCDEVIKPSVYSWFEHWVPQSAGFASEAFQNIYMLRDYFWSSNQQIFAGYQAGVSGENRVVEHPEFPEFLDALRNSFVSFPFVKKHFAHPDQAWEDAATINHDGSQAIISSLEKIATVIDDARKQKYHDEVKSMRDEMLTALQHFYISGEENDKREEIRRTAGEMKFGLDMLSPSSFGMLINNFMVSSHDLRYLATDIVLHKKELPQDFTLINVLRLNAGINPNDGKEVNLKKLCDYYHTNEQMLRDGLKMQNINLEDVICGQNNTMTTDADILAKNISEYWADYIESAAHKLNKQLIHSDRIAFMYNVLFKKFNIRQIIANKIQDYANTIEDRDVLSNIIADSISLMLNDFVTSVGRKFMTDEDILHVKTIAEDMHVQVDIQEDSQIEQPNLRDTMEAFEQSVETLRFQVFDEHCRNMLRRLPLWDNFKRWENLLVIGLMFTSDVTEIDEQANEQMRNIIEECRMVLNNQI